MMSSTSARKKKTILFLATNPKNSAKLRLDEEFRDVSEALKGAKNRSRFDLKSQWAIRRRDVRRAMLDYAPHIVHFAGHGAGEPGLLIENELGQAELLSSDALIGLFEDADQVECVLLNACCTEVQAKAIAQHVPYVIGMNQDVGDKAALEFAVGFYDALGAGLSIERAYKEGCKAIRMAGISEYLIPVLEHKTAKLEVEVQEKGSLAPTECSTKSRGETLPEPSTVSLLLKSAVWELEESSGQVPLDSPFYIERPPIESRCYEAIVKPGALIRIKAPRQMGKSSLTIRIFNHVGKQGYQAVWLQLQQAGEEPFASLDAFLQWLCRRVTHKLQLQDKVEEYWQSVAAITDKCTNYFELYLLKEINAPLVLCLDEVDEIFKRTQIADNFFGLLRSWHEESKINSVWRNLRLVVTHSEEVYVPLNINVSPFNVGVPIQLLPLNLTQLDDLVKRHGLVWNEVEVESLMAMLGGQPYLTRVALQQIASGALTLTQFLQVAPTQAGIFAAHLKRHLGNLQDRQLDIVMKQVVASDHPVPVPIVQASKLANMGLVRFQGNKVVPLCALYRNYFQDVLVGSR